jgi:hypothetical protein
VRHTDARRLTQSAAREHDRCVTRELVEPVRNLLGRNPQRTLERQSRIVLPPDVDEQRAVRERARALSPRRCGLESRARPKARETAASARGPASSARP